MRISRYSLCVKQFSAALTHSLNPRPTMNKPNKNTTAEIARLTDELEIMTDKRAAAVEALNDAQLATDSAKALAELRAEERDKARGELDMATTLNPKLNRSTMNTFSHRKLASEFKFFLGEQSHDLLADKFTFEECFKIFQAYWKHCGEIETEDLWAMREVDFDILTSSLPKRLAAKVLKVYGGGLISR